MVIYRFVIIEFSKAICSARSPVTPLDDAKSFLIVGVDFKLTFRHRIQSPNSSET